MTSQPWSDLELALAGFLVYERQSFGAIARELQRSPWHPPSGEHAKWNEAEVAAMVGRMMQDGKLTTNAGQAA